MNCVKNAESKSLAYAEAEYHGQRFRMLLKGPREPVQRNYHFGPLAGYQTILARQQFKSNGPTKHRTEVVVEEQRTLSRP